MFVVVGKQGVVVTQSEQLNECMKWLTAKAAEYTGVSWLPGPGQDVLTLTAGGQQWTLRDTREYFRWSVSIAGKPSSESNVAADMVLGVFSYLDDAKAAVEMTWGPAVYTPGHDEITNPADTIMFACGQVGGVLQRVRCYKAAAKLTD